MAVVTERPVDAPPPGDGFDRVLEILRRGAIAAPDRLVTVFLSACIPVGLAVGFRMFEPILVIPAVVVFVVGLWFVTPSRYDGRAAGPRWPAERAWRRGGQTDERAAARAAMAASVVGVAVLAWIWVNHHYVAQYVVLQRDPGIYTLRGMWLTNNSTPLIDMSTEAAAAGGVPGVSLAALAFPVQGETIYPQSSGLLPGLLGAAGWVKGLSALLSANLVVGAVALVAVYAFARRLLGPLWALLPFAALAVCMPMIAFSRAPYSEPTALAATFGGLLLLWQAWERRSVLTFAVAGLLMGVGSLARIDGGIALAGVLAGFGVVTLFARSTQLRRQGALYAAVFFVTSEVMNGFGLLDAWRNSPVYLDSESHNVVPLTMATVVVGIVVIAVAFVPLDGVRAWCADRRRLVARISWIGALVVGAVLISRPLWWTGRFTEAAGEPAVKGMQINSGLAVDPSRSYDESSINWLAMYFGWITVLLAAAGAALLARRIVLSRDPRIAVFVVMVAAGSLLYLNKISIFPDQIWAMRRFLPITIPGLLIAAAYGVRQFVRWRPRLAWLGVAVAVIVVGGAVLPWKGSVLTTANGAYQVAEMRQSCAVVAGRPVVLTGKNPGSAWFLPTFKIGCEVPTMQYVEATAAGLAKIKANYGTDVVVVTFDPTSVSWTTGTAPDPTVSTGLTAWAQPLQRVPSTVNLSTRQMYIGVVQPDGTVAPIAGPAG